jgi:hypothetical protein
MLRHFIDNFTDTSLENFLSELQKCIINDEYQNSFKTFKYTRITKNNLYKAIENYKNNGTIFYSNKGRARPLEPGIPNRGPAVHYLHSNLTSTNTGITIKRIGEIKIGQYYDSLGKNIKGVVPNGLYKLEFTVYYEKHF